MHFLLIGSKFYFVFLIMTMFPHIAGSELCCYYYAIYPECSYTSFYYAVIIYMLPLELHLTTSELWFGQEQEGILP